MRENTREVIENMSKEEIWDGGFNMEFHELEGSQAVTFNVWAGSHNGEGCRHGLYEVTLVEGRGYAWENLRGGGKPYWDRTYYTITDIDPDDETVTYTYTNDWGKHESTWKVSELEFPYESSREEDGREYLEDLSQSVFDREEGS